MVETPSQPPPAEVLAVIPARGGSKGIPRKNIRDFAGYPLIAYSIAAGLQASRVTRVIVSTDDEEIAAVARRWGAEVPFLRPPELAQDHTLDLPVFQHALAWLEEHENYHPDVVVQLRPTSPVRPPGLVDQAVCLLLDHPEADSVRGVVPAGQNPHKMWRIDPHTGQMRPLLTVEGIAEPYNAPRQVLPPVFWQTGHIDAIRPRVFTQGSMSGQVILPVQVDPSYTVDIDTPKDWARSEWLVHHAGLDIVTPAPLSPARESHPRHGFPPSPISALRYWRGAGGEVRRPHVVGRPIPPRVDLLVLDFDGVLTDNRVWVDETGRELVAAYRSDSIGLNLLAQAGTPALVLSTEVNPVVAARCRKMNLPYHQGLHDKAAALQAVLRERQVDPAHVVYVGNDVNDLPCFPLVACAVVVADALPAARDRADVILSRRGGHGAVRELCDWLLSRRS